jgi:hypothetical protein
MLLVVVGVLTTWGSLTRGVLQHPLQAEETEHWAYQPLRSAPSPAAPNAPAAPSSPSSPAWGRTELDRFVHAARHLRQLAPNPPADPPTLLRRLSLDLTGLPPTVAELEAWQREPQEGRWEAAVDRLLASPRFGEKWARHWLDVARYAESTGKTVNFAFPHAWRYRDYVIRAFNENKPFDQFIIEQLAGDLLPSAAPAQQAERLVATGFLAIGPKSLNELSGLKFELDLVDEQIDVTTQAFLGITVACARCHDHKSDPVTQRDYYALAGIFRSTETCYGTISFINAQRKSPLLALPADSQHPIGTPPLSSAERQRIEEQLQNTRESMARQKDPLLRFFATGQLALLQAKLDAYETDGQPKQLAMGVRDRPPPPETAGGSAANPGSLGLRGGRGRPASLKGFAGYTYDGSRTIGDSPIYERGEAEQPRDMPVPRGTVTALAPSPLPIGFHQSGRLELARWIASADNPLTARVFVNRVWRQLFGQGLVPTADDFGRSGRPPSHPELLDYLAQGFIADGWNIQSLIKRIVCSDTYQMSSREQPSAMEIDPDNTWLWRMTPRRLDAEVLRDSMLAVSGQLVLTPPVGSAVARIGEGPVVRVRFGGDPLAAAIHDPRSVQRSIYLPLVRDSLPESLALFDCADPSLITASRTPTIVPSQALFVLNNPFVLRAADATAEQLKAVSSDHERVELAYRRIFGRRPTAAEQKLAVQFVARYRAQIERERPRALGRDQEIWSAFCQAMLASAEFQWQR